MAQFLKMDPTRRDYVLDKGSSVPSDSVLEASYFAVMIPQNWLYGDGIQGSLVYTLRGQKRSANVEQRFQDYAKAAINSQVVATGKAASVTATNLEATRTGTSNKLSVVPAESQLADQLNFNPV